MPAGRRPSALRYPGLLGPMGLLFCLAACALLKYAFGVLICDDAYITLAHARSWNAGLGPIMSAQNPVCATSTPLHTMVLGLEGAILHATRYTYLAYFTNLAWDLSGLFFLHRIAARGLRLGQPFSLLALSAYALSVNFLAVSAYGMETPMYTALALAGSWFAFYSQRPFPALSIIAFLAALARPEGALLAGVLVPLHLWSRRRRGGNLQVTQAAIAAGAAAAGLALFFAFNLYAYGHWLPHSILAKRLEIHIGFREGLAAWILNVFHKGPCLGGATLTAALNLAVLAGAALGFARRQAPEERAPWPLLAWPFCYFLFFLLSGASYALFTWYYLPVLPFLILFLVAGLHRLSAGRAPEPAVWGGLFLFLAYVPAQTFRQHLPAKHVLAQAAREGRYREAARIIDSLSVPGKLPLVMIDEVGALGYYSHARILDTHGLLSPEALPYLGKPSVGESYLLRMAAMQERYDPDWIVGLRLGKDEGLLYPGEDALYSGYERVRTLRLPPHPYNLEMWRRLSDD